MSKLRPSAALAALALSVLGMFVLPACVARQGATVRPTVLADERQAYEYAVHTYQGGDYEASARLFGELADTAQDSLLSRAAFYGLALSRLAGAQTAKEFEAAMALWADWASLAPDVLPVEDPRLMAPILERVEARLKATDKALPPDSEAKPEPEAADLAAQRKQLAASREENAALKERLKELALENERLRNQLSALETLHQEILIKKKGFD